MLRRLSYHPFFIKLFHWEYWPFHMLYIPVYFYWGWLAIKARSFFFFNTSNPTIRNGGFLLESKKEIYDLIPSEYYPLTKLFHPGTDILTITRSINQAGFKYPLIGKPDIGMKGMGVKKLENEFELTEYASESKVDFLIQDFVGFKNEVGIFYYRYPNEKNGTISGIVRKEFLAVTGDGVSTMEDLIRKNKRYILQLPVLMKTKSEELSGVLEKGEEFILVPYGNHIRGAKFIDDSHLIDEELSHVIDTVCKKVNGFYFGRLDIRFNSWEELRQGKNFSIIELNGAGSEPTHIYDPKHSIFYAWKEIIRHLNIMWRISRMNHHPEERPFMNTKAGLKMLKENSRYIKKIKTM